jgi:hypothetical protein
MKPKTKMIFRRYPNGAICALMPEVPADVRGLYCTSYERHGQHGSADARGVIEKTTLATRKERAPLARELRRIGYRIEFRSRVGRNAMQKRLAEVRDHRA